MTWQVFEESHRRLREFERSLTERARIELQRRELDVKGGAPSSEKEIAAGTAASLPSEKHDHRAL